MNVIRRLERRLETMLDGMVGTVFRGPLHPAELAGRISREADLAGETTETATVVPNAYRLAIHPDDLAGNAPPPELEAELAVLVEELAMERGWRMNGPAKVTIVSDPTAHHGNPRCEGCHQPGMRSPWAVLRGEKVLPITVNRAVIGRGSNADVSIAGDTVSRRHALVWRQDDRVLLFDLGSANGTRVDSQLVGERAVEMTPPCTIVFGDAAYRFELR
jgi:hypothetical protein